MSFIKISKEMTVNCETTLIAVDQIVSIEAHEDFSRIYLVNKNFYDVGCLAQDIAEAVITAKRSGEVVTVADWE